SDHKPSNSRIPPPGTLWRWDFSFWASFAEKQQPGIDVGNLIQKSGYEISPPLPGRLEKGSSANPTSQLEVCSREHFEERNSNDWIEYYQRDLESDCRLIFFASRPPVRRGLGAGRSFH